MRVYYINAVSMYTFSYILCGHKSQACFCVFAFGGKLVFSKCIIKLRARTNCIALITEDFFPVFFSFISYTFCYCFFLLDSCRTYKKQK